MVAEHYFCKHCGIHATDFWMIGIFYALAVAMGGVWAISATITAEIFPTHMRATANAVANNVQREQREGEERMNHVAAAALEPIPTVTERFASYLRHPQPCGGHEH